MPPANITETPLDFNTGAISLLHPPPPVTESSSVSAILQSLSVVKITKVAESQNKETPHKVEVKNIYDHDNAQVMHITLMPGQSLKPHITPVDVFFYILEGNPSVLVEEEKIEVEKDSLVESPKT